MRGVPLNKYYILAVTTLSTMTLSLSVFSYPPVSGLVSSEFHLSFTQSGLVTSLYLIATAVTPIPAGYLADRLGGSKTLLASLWFAVIGFLAFALAPNYLTVLASRALLGVANGMTTPASVRLVAGLFERKHLPMAMGILGSGWGIGQVLSYLLLPIFIVGQNWRSPLLFALALVACVAAMGIPVARRESGMDVKVKPSLGRTRLADLLTRRLSVLIILNAVSVTITTAVFVWTPALLTTSTHSSVADAGRVIALAGVTNIIGSYAGAASAKRLGYRFTIGVSMVMLAIIPVLLVTSTSSSLLTAVWVAGLGWAGVFYSPAVFALIPASSARGLATVGLSVGLFRTISGIGSFISPLVVGYILDATGNFVLAFMMIGLIGITGIASTFFVRDPY